MDSLYRIADLDLDGDELTIDKIGGHIRITIIEYECEIPSTTVLTNTQALRVARAIIEELT